MSCIIFIMEGIMMKSRMKKILAVVLAVVTTVSCSVFAFADQTNDELLAQYYAALAKMQGNTAEKTNDELLAQYYAALAKTQGAANQKAAKTNGKPVEVDDSNFKEEVLDYNGVVVVDFYADWCGPCQSMVPIMKKIAKEHTEYKIVEVNVDYSYISDFYQVYSIPTFMVFKNGQLKGSFVGSCSEKTMLSKIKKLAK